MSQVTRGAIRVRIRSRARAGQAYGFAGLADLEDRGAARWLVHARANCSRSPAPGRVHAPRELRTRSRKMGKGAKSIAEECCDCLVEECCVERCCGDCPICCPCKSSEANGGCCIELVRIVQNGLLIFGPALLIIFGGGIGLMIGLLLYGSYFLYGAYLLCTEDLAEAEKQSAEKQIFVIHIQDAEANPLEVMLRTEAQVTGRRPWELPRGISKAAYTLDVHPQNCVRARAQSMRGAALLSRS